MGMLRCDRLVLVVVVVEILSTVFEEVVDGSAAIVVIDTLSMVAVSLFGESEYRSQRPSLLLPSFHDDIDAESSSSKSSNGSGVGSRLDSSCCDDGCLSDFV